MKVHAFGAAILLGLGLAFGPPVARSADLGAVDVLTGDTRLACEALLCLAASHRPSECGQAIRRYLSIKATRPDKLITKRLNFLNLCPFASASSEMSSYANALARGINRCDAAELNHDLRANYGSADGADQIIVRDELPGYCQALFNHQFVVASPPRYVGIPEYGGYWVEAEDYDEAYNRWRYEYVHKCAEDPQYQGICLQRLTRHEATR